MAVEVGFWIFIEGEGRCMKKELHLNLNSNYLFVWRVTAVGHPPTPPLHPHAGEGKKRKRDRNQKKESTGKSKEWEAEQNCDKDVAGERSKGGCNIWLWLKAACLSKG